MKAPEDQHRRHQLPNVGHTTRCHRRRHQTAQPVVPTAARHHDGPHIDTGSDSWRRATVHAVHCGVRGRHGGTSQALPGTHSGVRHWYLLWRAILGRVAPHRVVVADVLPCEAEHANADGLRQGREANESQRRIQGQRGRDPPPAPRIHDATTTLQSLRS